MEQRPVKKLKVKAVESRLTASAQPTPGQLSPDVLASGDGDDCRLLLVAKGVESRLQASAQPRPGPCTFCNKLLGDTQCSDEKCEEWCHYDPCYTRFCDASEFYPGLDPNPSRQGCMITFCYGCALMHREDFREKADAHVRGEDDDDYDSEATQVYDLDEYDSEATIYEYDLFHDYSLDPLG